MTYILFIIVFIGGYILCFCEPACNEKYRVELSDKIVGFLAMPAVFIGKIPVLKKTVNKNIKKVSLMKISILAYIMGSFVPSCVFVIIDDVNKIFAIWCIEGLFMVAVSGVVYFIYDVVKEHKWIIFKIFAIAFLFAGAFVMALMCISVATQNLIYVIVTLVIAGGILASTLALSKVEYNCL